MKPVVLKLVLSLVAVFAPVQGVMNAALTLIVADLITGVWAARRRGEPISSSGLMRSIVKLFVYEAAIMLGYIAQHYLMGDTLSICNIIGSYVGITELVSAYENINSIAGGELLKSILDRLNSKNNQ